MRVVIVWYCKRAGAVIDSRGEDIGSHQPVSGTDEGETVIPMISQI